MLVLDIPNAKEIQRVLLCGMKVTVLDSDLQFPPVEMAEEHGILAVGGDLEPATLISAYEHGAFPWFMPEDPLLWWAPPERAVLPVGGIRVSKSMRNELNRQRYKLTLDRAFEQVIRGCQCAPREGEGTWITDDIVRAYLRLHDLGIAHSVEVWQNDEVVGGLYGVSLGRMFFGESMFSAAVNASKVAFVQLARWLESEGFGPVDCQIMNPHLASMGVENWSRANYQEVLAKYLHKAPTLKGSWTHHEYQFQRSHD